MGKLLCKLGRHRWALVETLGRPLPITRTCRRCYQDQVREEHLINMGMDKTIVWRWVPKPQSGGT